jgi:hypothetical protein
VHLPTDVVRRHRPVRPFEAELAAYDELGIDLSIFVPHGDPVGYVRRRHEAFISGTP